MSANRSLVLKIGAVLKSIIYCTLSPSGNGDLPFNIEEGVNKLVFIVLGPFRMALFPELWNAGHHRLDNLPWQ